MRDDLEDLKKRVEELENRRIEQRMILPDAVKQRHVGEGVRFLRGGVATSKPIRGETTLQGYAVYFDTDANTLWIYNSVTGAWKSVTLS